MTLFTTCVLAAAGLLTVLVVYSLFWKARATEGQAARAYRRLAALVFVGLLALNLYQYFRFELLTRRGIVDQFHILCYDTKDTWLSNRFLGVLTMQNPNDAWITQEIITEVKPDFIVEAGTKYGGSAALWATLLQQVNPEGRVITIDIDDQTNDARPLPIFQQKVDFLLGSSTDPKIVADVAERVRGKKVMVLLDSDHRKSHVLDELKAYGPLVSPGSYLIVQDTDINGHPVYPTFGPGPMEALEEYLATGSPFESDRSRERMLFTMHPKGYLKRIK